MKMWVFIFNDPRMNQILNFKEEKNTTAIFAHVCRSVKVKTMIVTNESCNILNFLTLQNHGFSEMQCANYANKMTDLLEGF